MLAQKEEENFVEEDTMKTIDEECKLEAIAERHEEEHGIKYDSE